jgi:Na+-transporting NADH:ubiquinone oxidoreductase subunit C
MEQERIPFSETRLYPVIFMLIVALFFGTILAALYHNTTARIEENRRIRLQRAVLNSFGLPVDNVEEDYPEYIREEEHRSLFYYKAVDDTLTLGYCFPIEGQGLWGSISALLAVNVEFTRIIALEILDQNETPGLGGRITEEDFLGNFREKDFISDRQIVEFRLIPEDDSPGKYDVNQITGATSSSRAVVSMVYNNLRQIRDFFEAE